MPPQVAEQLNRRLARKIGADASGYDLTQLLRVPGTTNHKHATPVSVRELDGGKAYVPAELEALLPQEAEPTARQEPAGGDEEPPILLDPQSERVWRGEKPKAKADTGELDKSATLMKIGRVLFDAGANRRVLVDALAERDRTLGYRKYSDNRDGGPLVQESMPPTLRKAAISLPTN